SQDHFESKDVFARDAVFEAARAAGVCGDISTNATVRFAGGIGRIKTANLLDFLLEMFSQNARFNNRNEIVRIDFLDAIHPHQRERNAAATGNTSTDIAIAGASRGDWDFIFVRKG